MDAQGVDPADCRERNRGGGSLQGAQQGIPLGYKNLKMVP